MNDKERTFNKQYIKYGGIFLDNDSENGKEILKQTSYIREKVNNYYKDKKAMLINLNGSLQEKILKNINSEAGKYHPYVNVFCADKNDINAFAGKVEDDYYIGILKGVFLNLENHLKDFVEDENFANVTEIGKCEPMAILRNLLNTCMDFLTFHEYFHVMNGHLEYVKELGINELCEINTEETEHGIIRQVLEFDADCCAVASVVNEFFRMQHMAIQEFSGYSGRVNINSTVQFISTVLIATYILNEWLNKIHYFPELNEEYLEKMDHPLPGIRTWYMWFTIQSVIDESGIYNEGEVEIIMKRSYESIISFINAFNDIAYPGFLKIATQDLCINHLQKIHNNWKDVRELLTGHYCELAPYKEVDFNELFGR